MNQQQSQQDALVQASLSGKPVDLMPQMLGMQPPAPSPAAAVSAPVMPTTTSAPLPTLPPPMGPPMLGLGQGALSPQMLQEAGSYNDPNAQSAPPTFPWGGDPSALGGAAADLGGYMGY